MALWGNNDNVGSGGTVSLNYSTREIESVAISNATFGFANTPSMDVDVTSKANVNDLTSTFHGEIDKIIVAPMLGFALLGNYQLSIQFFTKNSYEMTILYHHAWFF